MKMEFKKAPWRSEASILASVWGFCQELESRHGPRGKITCLSPSNGELVVTCNVDKPQELEWLLSFLVASSTS